MTDLDAPATVRALRATFDSRRTRPIAWREQQLVAMRRMLVDNERAIAAALAEDLGKPRFETWAAEIQVTVREIDELRRNLRRWTDEERVRIPWVLRPGRAEIHREPLGVVLVIAPWNYPVHLLLTPMAAGIAAGNAVLGKPSELAPATSALMSRLAAAYLDTEAIGLVEGGVPETTALLRERFDHILYTGNGAVGRIVLEAAARHLTPTTLELGGKTPVIVDRDADLKLAAGRVAFAKWTNAGQTCIAADHVWVHEDVEDEFLGLLRREVKRRYGDDPRTSPDFGRIVNVRHARRLAGLLEAGGYDEVVIGGSVDPDDRYVAPTVVRGVKPEAGLMAEEIFGPILPVLTFVDLDEPIDAIHAGSKPLALYVFTGDSGTADRLLAETSSGGACVNDVMTQILVPGLPFGGVGNSGNGCYHGRWGMETFSHRKAVYRRPGWFIDPPVLRPPYRPWKQALFKRVF